MIYSQVGRGSNLAPSTALPIEVWRAYIDQTQKKIIAFTVLPSCFSHTGRKVRLTNQSKNLWRNFMAKLQKSGLIKPPVEKVFEYIVDPNNLPEIWPSLLEVKDVQRAPSGDISSYKWTYKMAGIRFEGTTEITEIIQNQRIVIKDRGGIEGTRTTSFLQENEGTRVTVDADYTIPVALLGRLAEPFIVKQNEQEVDTILLNLKVRMES